MISCTTVPAFLSQQCDNGAGCHIECFYASDHLTCSSVRITHVLSSTQQHLLALSCAPPLSQVIGEGSFGTTYRGTWKGGNCAVKCVRIANPDEAQSFLREVETLALIRHPNIMPFYGALIGGGTDNINTLQSCP